MCTIRCVLFFSANPNEGIKLSQVNVQNDMGLYKSITMLTTVQLKINLQSRRFQSTFSTFECKGASEMTSMKR